MGYVLSEITDWIVCLVSSITAVIGLVDLLPPASSLIIAVMFVLIAENFFFKVGNQFNLFFLDISILYS